jgi:hypothetical protein
MQILFEGCAGPHQRALQPRSASTVAMTMNLRWTVAA